MTKDQAMKWVEALRSGKFKQGTGMLYNPNCDRYCCLGVLCAINNVLDVREYANCVGVLSEEQKDATGLRSLGGWAFNSQGPVALAVFGNNTLASANDSGKSFAEIADWIEANYEQL